MPSDRPIGSIQARLLKALMASLLPLLLLCGGVTWFVAYRVANDAYDHALLDPVMDIVQNVRQGPDGATLTLTEQEQAALLFDGSDRVFFRVRGPDGRWIAGGLHDLPAPPATLVPRVPRFYSASVDRVPLRICALLTNGGFEVYVAETTNKRDRLVWEIILAGFLPSLLVGIVAVALVWLGVSHGLSPLRKLRNELQQRSPNDLHAVDESHAPSEVRPAIVALNRLFQRIRETSESQRRFLADAAHQLRTPLAGLQMQVELELRESNSASSRATLGKMRDAVLRTGRLTNRLLALARAEQTGPDARDFTDVDLYAIVERVGTQWIPRAIAADIDLGFDLATARVTGDDTLLGEMLENLIDNAIRYTPAGGSVTVRCGVSAAGPYFSVDDNGIGIPPAERDRVFARFYRVAGVGGDGAGLGLAIVREGADRHRASVVISTPTNGTGTAVCVTFESGKRDAVAPATDPAPALALDATPRESPA